MKKILIAISLLLLPFALFAAGSKETQETEPITITWWHSNSGILQEATEELISSFNTTVGKEKGIKVEAIYQGKANDVLVKLKAVTADTDTSQYPDIVQLDASGALDIVSSNIVTYTQDLAEKYNDDLSFLQENTKESLMYKDRLIGMPFNASTILYYYNKTAFDEQNLTPPETIDELIQIAPLLVQIDAKGNTTRYAFSNIPTTYELTALLGSQNGVSYITDMENGHQGTPTKTVFKENGTFKNLLTKWKKLYATGGLENASSGITASFVAGKTASFLASTSNLTTIIQSVGNRFELGVAPCFRINENDKGGVNVGGGALYAVTKDNSKQEAAVWEFLKYATSKEAQLKWHIKTGYLPVNKETYEMNEYKSFITQNPLFEVPAKQLFASNPKIVGVWIPSGYQIYYSFMSNIKKMLTDNISVDATVNAMQKEIDGYLKDYNV